MSSGTNRDIGRVFDIQRFSLHDGPGIRTILFMKGCPLRCKWCANPESQKDYTELGFLRDRCIGWNECDLCLDVCSVGAISKDPDGKVNIDRNICIDCGDCAETCPSRALRIFGYDMSLSNAMEVLLKDCDFYSRSGGGVTIGGGEPLSQAMFVSGLLKELRSRGIDTAVETCGYGPLENLKEIARHANFLFYDIKHMNSKLHKAYTGVENELVLENLAALSASSPEVPIVARTPVVPGFNDSEENIKATVEFLLTIENVKRYELLTYHGFGESKYRQLGRSYSLRKVRPLEEQKIKALQEIGDHIGNRQEISSEKSEVKKKGELHLIK